jgi:hypothetical protein
VSYSKASNYPEKMVEEKKIQKKLATKNTQKKTSISLKSRKLKPKNLNYTKGTIGPWYLYAQKIIKENK